MASTVTIGGVTGSLRWGYHEAAVLASWTLTNTTEGWTLTATVVSVDAFRVSQHPLVFLAPHASGAWRWPVKELQIMGATLTASLGPKE